MCDEIKPKKTVMMVNLYHPCYEVHVWVVDNQDDYDTALAQGYETLETLRANHAEGFFSNPKRIEDV